MRNSHSNGVRRIAATRVFKFVLQRQETKHAGNFCFSTLKGPGLRCSPSTESHSVATIHSLSTKLRALGLQADRYSGHSFQKGAAQHAHDSGILTTKFRCSGAGHQMHLGYISQRTRQSCTKSVTSFRQARRLHCLSWFRYRPLHHPSLAWVVWALSDATV